MTTLKSLFLQAFRGTAVRDHIPSRRRSVPARLTFEVMEQRCLLSCPPWGNQTGGEGLPPDPIPDPIPDPPDAGDYTRAGVTITWTCDRPSESGVVLTGSGSNSAADPADATFTLTVSVDVTEYWSFLDPIWAMTNRMGWATEGKVKDEPGWRERTSDHFTISQTSEMMVARDYFLDKIENQFGTLYINKADWAESYLSEGSFTSKEGYESSESKPQDPQPPNAGSFNTAGERTEWTGPVEWTIHEENDFFSNFFDGKQTSANSISSRTVRTFADYTAPDPISEDETFSNASSSWFASGNPQEARSFYSNTITDYVNETSDQVEMLHEKAWFDSPGKVASDTRKKTYSDTVDFAQPLVTYWILSRETTYSAPGKPESFDFVFEDDRALPGAPIASLSVNLEWTNTGYLNAVNVDSVDFAMPLSEADWDTLTEKYGQCFYVELEFFGSVPEGAYPSLSPLIY